MPKNTKGESLQIAWNEIDHLLLDMDGTLLDLNFDNHFWLEFVPARFAQQHKLSLQQAKNELQPRFDALKGKLEWYCLDYWSRELKMDLTSLKKEIAGLIRFLPHVVDFLEAARRRNKPLWLVTNAHPATLSIKLEQTCLQRFFDLIVCSHDFGFPKENVQFWEKMVERHAFRPSRTLLIDDSVAVLEAGRRFGIAYPIAVSRPDSQMPARIVAGFPAVTDLKELLPL